MRHKRFLIFFLFVAAAAAAAAAAPVAISVPTRLSLSWPLLPLA
jgi:hypothetical protein